MKSYYLHQEHRQRGPYSIKDLKKMQIQPAKQVWKLGLPGWTEAQQIPELRSALFLTPHATMQGDDNANPVAIQGLAIGRFWKEATIALAILLAILIIIKSQKENSYVLGNNSITHRQQMGSQSSEELHRKEMQKPGEYISGKIATHTNLQGETLLEGTLINTATLANFRDPVLVFIFLSRNNTPVGTVKYTVPQYLAAGQAITYKHKLSLPYQVAGVEASIESAKAVD